MRVSNTVVPACAGSMPQGMARFVK